MQIERVTQHNHTDMTNHGHAPIEELIAHAHEVGITNIAVTEHYPLTAAVDPRDYVSMHADRLDEYVRRILAQRQAFPDMEILVGCELDWLGAGEDRQFAPDAFDCFDIVLGSVHFVDLWPFDDPAQAGHWDEVGPDSIWKRYFEVWCEAVSSKVPYMPFDAMAHPDLVKKFGRRPSFDPHPLYRQAAEAAAAGGRMVEVNTSGVTYACKEMFPHADLLREFCRAGVPCTLGTDAHTVTDVDRDIEAGYRLMYEAGYRELTVVVPGGDRRTIALG